MNEVKNLEYHVFLKNYDSLYVIKTNTYNVDVKEILKWFFGNYYHVELVLENPKIIFSNLYVYETREELLEDIEWKCETYYFDEEGEELDSKIKYLKSILI